MGARTHPCPPAGRWRLLLLATPAFLLFSAQAVAGEASSEPAVWPRRIARAVRVPVAPRIDGRLDDDAWAAAQAQSGFVQRVPDAERPDAHVVEGDFNLRAGSDYSLDGSGAWTFTRACDAGNRLPARAGQPCDAGAVLLAGGKSSGRVRLYDEIEYVGAEHDPRRGRCGRAPRCSPRSRVRGRRSDRAWG